ncbi:hypothetical protein ACFU5Y_07355 [Streptomyces gardneri]|uniref:hypothetical protein n=1 Tax=Streptomyces gardneri TaxID=66892 RepID=UPI0036CA0E15
MSPVMSPAKLRMIGLGTAVAVAVLVPIVAVAGPTGDPVRPAGPGDAKSGAGAARAGDGAGAPAGDGGLLSDLGLGHGARTAESPAAGATQDRASVPSDSPAASSATSVPSATPAAPERITKCGPELASPEGIEAQTCVLAEGPDIWARTYYRNATGQQLDAFLTLMAPGGRTVQVRCPVAAQDEPGTCETPRERGQGKATAYTAVAEFAGTGEGGSTPLLLRSGSNTADTEGS